MRASTASTCSAKAPPRTDPRTDPALRGLASSSPTQHSSMYTQTTLDQSHGRRRASPQESAWLSARRISSRSQTMVAPMRSLLRRISSSWAFSSRFFWRARCDRPLGRGRSSCGWSGGRGSRSMVEGRRSDSETKREDYVDGRGRTCTKWGRGKRGTPDANGDRYMIVLRTKLIVNILLTEVRTKMTIVMRKRPNKSDHDVPTRD